MFWAPFFSAASRSAPPKGELTDLAHLPQYWGMRAILLGTLLVGCSAGGLLIDPTPPPPPRVPTSTTDDEAIFITVAEALKQAVGLTIDQWLHAPTGTLTPASILTKGTLTLDGSATHEAADAEALTLNLTMDAYSPPLYSTLLKKQVRPLATAADAAPPTFSVRMSAVPSSPRETVGTFQAEFDGHILVVGGPLDGDLEVHLNVTSPLNMFEDGVVVAKGASNSYGVRVAGVILAPSVGAYSYDVYP